jgi:hypothetical protein
LKEVSMRRTLVIGVVLLAGLALVAPTSAQTPTERKLLKQVATLKKQVVALQKTTKKLQTDLRNTQVSAGGAIALAACTAAVTADALQGSWAAINTREASRAAPAVFPSESAVNDAGTCQALRITRTPTANPPNLTAFKGLLAILQSFM